MKEDFIKGSQLYDELCFVKIFYAVVVGNLGHFIIHFY